MFSFEQKVGYTKQQEFLRCHHYKSKHNASLPFNKKLNSIYSPLAHTCDHRKEENSINSCMKSSLSNPLRHLIQCWKIKQVPNKMTECTYTVSIHIDYSSHPHYMISSNIVNVVYLHHLHLYILMNDYYFSVFQIPRLLNIMRYTKKPSKDYLFDLSATPSDFYYFTIECNLLS